MKKFILAHPFIFAVTILLGIATQGLSAFFSLFLMHVVDSITVGDMDSLITSIYYGMGFVALFFVLLYMYTRFTVMYSYKTIFRLKNDIFSAILRKKISDFNQSNSAKYISAINNDIQMVNDKYIASILAITKDVSTMLFALGAMAFLSPVNALVALILSSSPMVLPAIFGKKLSSTNMTHMRKLSTLNEKVKDFLSGFEVIKTFGIEKNIGEKFSRTALAAEEARYDANKVSVKVGSLSGTSMVATQLVTYLVAGYFVITGSISIGAVIAIAGLSGTIMHPINLMAINFSNIKSTKDIRGGLLETMETPNNITKEAVADFADGITLRNLSFKYEVKVEKKGVSTKRKPTIRMVQMDGRSLEETLASVGITSTDNVRVMDGSNIDPDTLEGILDPSKNASKKVMEEAGIPLNEHGEPDIAAILASHGYTDVDMSQVKVIQSDNTDEVADLLNEFGAATNQPKPPIGAVLKNVNYSFKKGGKYAIIGGSGSGKSTLLKLVMGYYDDYLGELIVGNSEIRDVNRESLYGSLSMIHQNVFLLDDTLRNNITLDNPYTDQEFESAVTSAKLLDVIDALPNGSLSRVGEGGNTLSGGEKQRVAIARALIKGCEVMILDEAMASLDNETAYEIENALLTNESLTCIFVTHRYNKELLQKYDGILVMKKGELVESGTFDDLYDQKGYFYSLYNRRVH